MVDSEDMEIKAMERTLKAEIRYYELTEIEERIIDANCNMLSRIIDYCRKNSIPFDNGLIVLLHEARKCLSPEAKRLHLSPEDGTEPKIARQRRCESRMKSQRHSFDYCLIILSRYCGKLTKQNVQFTFWDES